MVTENSMKAYQELIESKLLGKRQLEVFKAILQKPNQTDRELAEQLDQEDSNYLKPRRRDLERLGLIEKTGDRTCSISHKTASTWKKKSYDLNKLLEAKNKPKDSNYYWKRVIEADIKLTRLKEKYYSIKRAETKQMSLFDRY